MKCRNFLNTMFSAAAGIGLSSCIADVGSKEGKKSILQNGSFSVDGNRVTYYLDGISEPVKIIQVTDTHLWMDDERGEPFHQYSARMARAYNQTRHFRTAEATNPEEAFKEVLKMAVEKEADLFTMTGDIFSFPSEAAIEWLKGKVEESGLKYLFVSGNHDWHYEGMEGSIHHLRETWINKRLIDLYQGKDPMMAAYDIKGVTVLAIDNATYEVTPGQLEFFKGHVSAGRPMALMMHIPMYAPGRSIWFGCGNPDWSAATDRNYQLEGRERWPEEGHTKTTVDYHKQVFAAPNLLGVFAGHTHRHSVDLVNGIPQFVAAPNSTGAYLEVDILPLEDEDREVILT